ncbi:MAG: heavy-metal-associated domain-containing protein [Prevotella sp.]|nr:heavy-metal-associated domain-containing protein [Prevotella sp.]MDY3935049.1 heavy-metal-associated domain-containing protein [Prevotella sp.]MDY4217915.1 heavy-metal-associated domain-containing protein [Prevotella sp.]
METKTFKISGMKCPHCKAKIETALSELDGINHFDVSLPNSEVTLVYDPSIITPEAIKAHIESNGRYELSI